jgi:hypothetical protein
MFGDGGTNEWWVNALFWASIILFGVAVFLFAREHSRRLESKGMTPLAARKPGTTAAASAVDVPELSPWLAAFALGAFGLYMFFANSIDERPKDQLVKLSGCDMTVSVPAEARATSAVVVEASLTDNRAQSSTKTSCVSVLRTASLVVDGAAAKDDFPVVLEDKGDHPKWERRWFVPAQTAGKHRLDVLAKEKPGSFTASATVGDTKPKIIGKANELPGCKTVPVLPAASKKPETVVVDLKITCGAVPQDLVPSLYVNGTVAKILTTIDVSGTRVFRWTFARTAAPDRLDFVVTDIADDWTWPILVRQPPTLGNVKDGIAGLSGVVVALSGLLVGVLQFLKGHKVT